jgi:hypothetical protein
MRASRSIGVPFALLMLAVSTAAVVAQTPAAEPQDARTWIGRAAEIEEYLRTAEIVKLERIGTGVTNPFRAFFAPGGLCESMAFKPIREGMTGGHMESYKTEIAAYEIDKLLELSMVPPTIERRVKNDLGSGIMWVAPTRSFKQMGGAPVAPPRYFDSFNRQMVRAKMYDNLIGNLDPNLGNWLVDPAWNLILIDHTRALTTLHDRVHKLTRIDGPLWQKMQALTEESLTAAAGKWIGRGEIRAILERRKRMQADIDKLIKENGEDAVVMK